MENKPIDFDEGHLLNIAHNLRHLMKLKSITESKLAQELQIPVMTIRRLLSGETTDPRVFTLKSIANFFNVSVDTLIGIPTMGAYEFNHPSKPLFIPILDWELATNINSLDLNNWQSWIPVTVSNNIKLHENSFALESKPSMFPRFQPGTIFIFDPSLMPSDGDLVLVNLIKTNELTLRQLCIDPPDWQLHTINQLGSSTLQFSSKEHEIIAIVFLTLFYNRKMHTLG